MIHYQRHSDNRIVILLNNVRVVNPLHNVVYDSVDEPKERLDNMLKKAKENGYDVQREIVQKTFYCLDINITYYTIFVDQ